ncbi:MAG: ATP-grasp domain-containing protein [Eggerthellaceae bacterium]|nr:ATP-grasp domain-containing protein [Eggerthellaceae bacterium]
MSNVLVTSIGSVAADITIKSLKRLGHRVVGADIYPREWVVDAYNVDAFYKVPLVSDAETYLSAVHSVCEQESIDYFIPLIDPEVDLLNASRGWFEEHGVTLCISTKRSLDIIRNKKSLQDFIEDEVPEINGIPTLMVGGAEKLPWGYPVVVKPYDGRSSQGREYISSDEEWETYKEKRADSKSIVEPFVSGPLVMVEVVRQGSTGKCVCITRQELLSTPHGCATTVRVYSDPDLEAASKVLAEKLNVNGCVNFEFIKHEDGRHFLVECNPRYSAGLEFSCLAGYDCVANHLDCFGDHPIDEFEMGAPTIVARKYEEYVTSVERGS